MITKPCPFCGTKMTDFGHDIRNGEKVKTVIHPAEDDTWDRCPLSGLVFDLDRWQKRSDDEDLRSRIVQMETAINKIIAKSEENGLFDNKSSTVFQFGSYSRKKRPTNRWRDYQVAVIAEIARSALIARNDDKNDN